MPVRGRALSILVHADTKVGKSTFGATAPRPILLLDAEAAHRFLLARKVFWNPLTDGPPPVPDGSWDICVVIVRDYATLRSAVSYLEVGQHYFESVVIDSISEIQKKAKDDVSGGGPEMDQRKWGEILWHMETLIRKLRDLTEHPTRPITALVLTAMTEQRDGKWKPYVQGQLRTTLPYFIDVVGYMFVKAGLVVDPTAPPPPPIRVMLTRPHMQFEAGERVQGRLPEFIEDRCVNVQWMLDSVFGPVPDLNNTQTYQPPELVQPQQPELVQTQPDPYAEYYQHQQAYAHQQTQ